MTCMRIKNVSLHRNWGTAGALLSQYVMRITAKEEGILIMRRGLLEETECCATGLLQ